MPAQVYHLKAAGKKNWPKMQQAIDKIEAARKSGQKITADMYAYTAGATGLDASMPTWVQEGGIDAWVARSKKPEIRARVIKEMRDPNADFESLLQARAMPADVLLIGFKTDKLKPLTGKTLAEVAKMRGVIAGRRGDRSGHRRSHAGRHRLLPDVGREREARSVAALGEHRFGCGSLGAGRAVPAQQSASAHLRHVRSLPRQVCAR